MSSMGRVAHVWPGLANVGQALTPHGPTARIRALCKLRDYRFRTYAIPQAGSWPKFIREKNGMPFCAGAKECGWRVAQRCFVWKIGRRSMREPMDVGAPPFLFWKGWEYEHPTPQSL